MSFFSLCIDNVGHILRCQINQSVVVIETEAAVREMRERTAYLQSEHHALYGSSSIRPVCISLIAQTLFSEVEEVIR